MFLWLLLLWFDESSTELKRFHLGKIRNKKKIQQRQIIWLFDLLSYRRKQNRKNVCKPAPRLSFSLRTSFRSLTQAHFFKLYRTYRKDSWVDSQLCLPFHVFQPIRKWMNNWLDCHYAYEHIKSLLLISGINEPRFE